MRYRVNFGNGQVHYAGSRLDCISYIRRYGDRYSFVEFQDSESGDWFSINRIWRIL